MLLLQKLSKWLNIKLSVNQCSSTSSPSSTAVSSSSLPQSLVSLAHLITNNSQSLSASAASATPHNITMTTSRDMSVTTVTCDVPVAMSTNSSLVASVSNTTSSARSTSSTNTVRLLHSFHLFFYIIILLLCPKIPEILPNVLKFKLCPEICQNTHKLCSSACR